MQDKGFFFDLPENEQDTPSVPLLTPPPRESPETLLLVIRKESDFTEFNEQGRD
jgi:hypothetical protein|tara:strand:- start:4284 stop:4445 length:162 start_codon:yes stop_codon:yes gene_type:complete